MPAEVLAQANIAQALHRTGIVIDAPVASRRRFSEGQIVQPRSCHCPRRHSARPVRLKTFRCWYSRCYGRISSSRHAMPQPLHYFPPLLASTPYPILAQRLWGPCEAMAALRPPPSPVHFQSLPRLPGVEADRRNDLRRGPEPLYFDRDRYHQGRLHCKIIASTAAWATGPYFLIHRMDPQLLCHCWFFKEKRRFSNGIR